MNYQSLVEFQYWTVIGQICNLLLQMYLFKRFLFKPIKDILAKRQSEVDNTYDEAAKAKVDAENAKATAKNTPNFFLILLILLPTYCS